MGQNSSAPTIVNPYPENPVVRIDIDSFKFETPLCVGRAPNALKMRSSVEEDADYIVTGDYTVSFTIHYNSNGPGKRWSITVPAGLLTDFASVPRIFRSLVGRVGPHLEATIVHDYLFVAWQELPGHGARKQDWEFSNLLMDVTMKRSKVGTFRHFLIMFAVNNFSWGRYSGKNGVSFTGDIPCCGGQDTSPSDGL